MIEITRHMDGRTAVIGALVTAVPKDAEMFETVVGDTPLTIMYLYDEDVPIIWALANGLDVFPLLAEDHADKIAGLVADHDDRARQELQEDMRLCQAYDRLLGSGA